MARATIAIDYAERGHYLKMAQMSLNMQEAGWILERKMKRDFVCHLMETRPPLSQLAQLNIVSSAHAYQHHEQKFVGHTPATINQLAPSFENVVVTLNRLFARNSVAHLLETKALLKDQLFWPYPLCVDKPSKIAPSILKVQAQLKFLVLRGMLWRSLQTQTPFAASWCLIDTGNNKNPDNNKNKSTLQKESRCQTKFATKSKVLSRKTEKGLERKRMATNRVSLAELHGTSLTSDCGLAHTDLGKATTLNSLRRQKQGAGGSWFCKTPRFQPTTSDGAIISSFCISTATDSRRENQHNKTRSRRRSSTSRAGSSSRAVSFSTFTASRSVSVSKAKDAGMGGRAQRFLSVPTLLCSRKSTACIEMGLLSTSVSRMP
jgi:hypothetical protein